MSDAVQEAREAVRDVSTEKLKEWLTLAKASKSVTQYGGIDIDCDTLADIIREREKNKK